MLSSTVALAVKALRVIARSDCETSLTVAAEIGVSNTYAGDICSRMTRAGLLTARKGQPNGGVTLARELSRISIADVSVAISGRKGCLLRTPTCTVEDPCRICSGVLKVLEATVEEVVV